MNILMTIILIVIGFSPVIYRMNKRLNALEKELDALKNHVTHP